jgi:RHS repeat-associated protein
MLMENTDFRYDNPYKYNAKEFDMATGYYYYGARYYDPKRSFWLSVDPLAEITLSPYAYVWNDPVNFTDPTGMMGERAGKPNDWGRKGNKWEWKKEITKDNYKRLGYQAYSDGKTNNTYKSDTGSFVALRENGNWSKDLQPQSFLTSPPNQAWSDFYKPKIGDPTISSPSSGRGKSKFDYVMVDANPLMKEMAKRVCIPCGTVADMIEFTTEQTPVTVALPSSRGHERAIKFGNDWEESSLSKTIAKFTPHAKPTFTLTGKSLYLNPVTGMQVVVDNTGGYFRIQDTKLLGRRVYTDLNGNIPNNKIINGKTVGRTQSEYNQVTHFRIK